MIQSAPLSWLLTIAFAAIGVYYARRCIRAPGGAVLTRTELVSSLAHVVMSFGMVPMLWWWGMGLPAVPQDRDHRHRLTDRSVGSRDEGTPRPGAGP